MPRFALLACVLIAILPAAENAVVNGDFERLEDGWYPAWTRGDPALVHPVQEGGDRFVRLRLGEHAAAMIAQTVPLDPTWREIGIAFEARSSDLVPGADEPWMTARIQFLFEDAAGERVGGWPDLRVRPGVAGWQSLRATHEVPDGATRVALTLGSWGAKGTIDFDDVTLAPTRTSEAQAGGAAGPVRLTPAVEELGPRRHRMSLHGEWRFLPGVGPAGREPTAEGWGLIRVPGSWHDAVTRRGGGEAWRQFQPQATNKAWYQCELVIPADWRGRALDLHFDRVSTDAQVWVNGQEVGTVRWPWGAMEIQDQVRWGEPNQILVGVVSLNDRSTVTRYMGYVDEPTSEARLDSRGIIGPVELLARPAGGHLHDLNIRPSVRQQALEIDLELRAASAGILVVEADMRDEQGAIERSFRTEVAVPAAGDQTVTARFDWADPRLWDVHQPERYHMDLRLSGAGIDDAVRQTFGFREFWIEGRDFYLNGSLIRLRPGNVDYGATAEDIRRQGMNFGHHWPRDQVRRGTISDYDLPDIERADRLGILCDANVAHMAWYIGNERWDDPAARAEYRHIIDQQVRRYRNHPSVVMYTHTANALAWTGDGDPWTLGERDVFQTQEKVRDHRRVHQLIAEIKAIDDKPVYAHFGADMGDVSTSNLYLDLLPLQEREEWLSRWTVDGDLPYYVVEFGMPLYATMMRGRSGYTHQGHSEPLPTEFSASYLGAEAYRLEQPALRQLLAERFTPGDLQKEYQPHIRHDRKDQVVVQATAFERLLDLFVTNTWRSWRSLGVSGGMVPWHHGDHPALARVNRPTLAWIAGPGGVPDQDPGADEPLTAKTHHYAPGGLLRKQVILINDHRHPVAFAGSLTLTREGEVVDSRELAGELATSEQRHLPIEHPVGDAPGVGTLELRLRIGDHDHEHVFPFQVVAPAPAVAHRLAVFDPAGDTAAWLRERGCEVVAWDAGAPTTAVAVVGRGALAAGHQLPAAIAGWVAAGGRLLVMGQDPDWIEHALHLRTAAYATRRVFAIDPEHAVLEGLGPENLHDWNGSGTLIEAYPRYPGFDWVPTYGWHWGNRHSVSSAPVEKPHRGAWRPLLECEFDLAYSPLLELDHGRGRVTLCTLDLEARSASDPAAERLGANLLEHVAEAIIAPRRATVYLGGDAGAERLHALGLRFERSETLPEPDALVVIGPDAAPDETALRRFLSAGGHALALRREAGRAPLGLRLERRDAYHGSLAVPRWEQTAGLGAGDLRWRGEHPAWVVAEQEGVETGGDGQLGRVALGAGVLILAQLGPDAVPADDKRYFRFTRWRQTRALGQLLTNLGASFEQDARFLDLLHQPDHYLPLAGGDWLARNTIRLVESPDRQWHGAQPISDAARALLAPDADTAAMQRVPVPAYLETYGEDWRWIDGETVFRREFQWPAHAAGKRVFVSLGRVDEHEATFLNGEEIGRSKHWLFARGHHAEGDLVRAGRNVLAVRNWDEGIHGGICGSPDHLFVRVVGEDPGFYHPDHLGSGVSTGADEAAWKARHEQWKVADDPYRYYRW